MTAVLSVEYAQELVQRAHDGVTFIADECGYWYPVASNSYPARHWVAWYRETRASWMLCYDVCQQYLYVYEADAEQPSQAAEEIHRFGVLWKQAGLDLGGLIDNFAHYGLAPLGRLCPCDATRAELEAAGLV